MTICVRAAGEIDDNYKQTSECTVSNTRAYNIFVCHLSRRAVMII